MDMPLFMPSILLALWCQFQFLSEVATGPKWWSQIRQGSTFYFGEVSGTRVENLWNIGPRGSFYIRQQQEFACGV